MTETSKPLRSPSASNWLIVFTVIALAILPLLFVQGEYSGADAEAQEAITEIQPNYEPWFTGIYKPPSGEIESLLFAVQAALGAGTFGYILGLYQERSSRKKPRTEQQE